MFLSKNYNIIVFLSIDWLASAVLQTLADDWLSPRDWFESTAYHPSLWASRKLEVE